jgi:ADP-ribosyl-[dinitrogen reductase] hydrolase
MITAHDRIRGTILGTLVGDALGVPVEFNGRSSLDRDPVSGMRGFGTWNQPPGTWSDDGAMALATTDALATHGWDPVAMMDGFLRWYDEAWWTAHHAVFDIGGATRAAIIDYRINRDVSDCGRTDENANGNGSLMRLAPVSAWLAGGSSAERIALAGAASALTHAHVRSRLCCAYHALWFAAVQAGADIRSAAGKAAQRLHREVPADERTQLARLLDGSALDLAREAVVSGGYVVSTLEASLWCLARHDSFDRAVLAAVNLGGDTDTTGAVAGGMAGWLYGAEAIPQPWIAALPRLDEVEGLIARFAERCVEQWAIHDAD